MHQAENKVFEKSEPGEAANSEMADRDWHKIYFAVLVTTVVVIGALWIFSSYFSG